ncbi:hypothetical protein [Streptomyces sp. NBC_00564]|uniref:hypothetical protein n=1 Tax=Streptomyces sp. NBC_00564 TaxID=2903663 RepID=UPI002FCDE12D|nr:hypothetical protein OG256_46070 [Streptomyces sp. NBC_00564]
MSESDERHLVARRAPAGNPAGDRDPAADVHPAFARFLRSVDEDVRNTLTQDEVDLRLAQLLRAYAAPNPALVQDTDPAEFETRAAWAAYGSGAVTLWLITVNTSATAAPRLSGDDIDEITVETVARALNSLRDESPQPALIPAPQEASTRVKILFLMQCVRHLPFVYECNRLMSEEALLDEFENMAASRVITMLWHCATAGRDHTLHRLGLDQARDTDRERREILALAPAAIRTASDRYPDAVDPASLR